MRLRGPIECRRTAPACLTLVGATESGERAYVTLVLAAAADLPPRIDDGTVDLLEGGRCRLSVPGREWYLDASQLLVHRGVSDLFCAAVPPRPAPLARRWLYRLMLAFAGSRAGRRWLAR